MRDALVADLTAAGLSQRAALATAGVSRSTWYYRDHPRSGVIDPIPQSQRAQPAALSATENTAIRQRIRAGWAAGRSVELAFYDAFDQGIMLGSLRTWYRQAHQLQARRPTRRRRNRRASAMPQWQAHAPGQVWCWDVTKLPGTYIRQSWSQYTVIDVFSRKIIASVVHAQEDEKLAKQLFQDAIAREGGAPRIVHSDGGATMQSNLLRDFYRHSGITPSRNRPRVSNDNPFIESYFRTEKYRSDYPGIFHTLEAARQWSDAAVADYNDNHHHSALAGYTPTQIHNATWPQVHQARTQALDRYYAQHPERFHQKPHPKTPPQAVHLNPDPDSK